MLSFARRSTKFSPKRPDLSPSKEPTRSLRGLLAIYGPALSAEEIDESRAEMFQNFPRSDF